MNKKAIIEIAIDIANKKGLENVTIANLSQAFKVKSPSMYKHIESLGSLIDELGILCLENLINIIRSECFGLSGDQAILQFFNSSRTYALNNPGLYQAMQKTHLHRSKEYQSLAVTLISLISKLLSPYKIKNDEIIHVIRYLRALIHGFIDLEIKNGFGLPEKINESYAMAASGFIRQLNLYGKRRKFK